MSLFLVAILFLAFAFVETVAVTSFLTVNASRSSKCANPAGELHGNGACPCVGIDNLKGYYAKTIDYYHVQRGLEAGASCVAWDDGSHPQCRSAAPPAWCKQKWCYVDPCNCDLEVPPKPTEAGIKYQGNPAFWSYKTCGGTDLWTSGESSDSCNLQKDKGACAQNAKCAWDGKKCGGKAAIDACKASAGKDEAVHGKEDCRCVGFGGYDAGKAFLFVNDTYQAKYSPNVGGTCGAWEMDSHPDCLRDGEKPAWCPAKWCFVDPCKCKSKVPPKAVMKANSDMRFQGKTAYWSYETCGSKDSWSSAHASEYCPTQKTEKACSKLSKCAWTGKECLGKALANICEKQRETGVLGVEAPLESSASSLWTIAGLTVLLRVFIGA